MLEEFISTGINMANVIKNNVQSKELDMQQKTSEIALSKDLFNKQFNALDEVLQDNLNILDKVDYDIFYGSQNLPKCIEEKQFQQGKEKFDTDCNTNITTSEKWENIFNKLQEGQSSSSQKITEEEKVNKDMSEKFEHNIAHTNTVTQQDIEENTLSKKDVKSIESLCEQLEQNKEKLKTIKSTQQEMTTNVKVTDIKKINSFSKNDLITKNELMRQNAYLQFIAANEQNELKKLRAQLQMQYNRSNMPDEKLEITTCTDFIQETNMMNKIVELKNEILKFKLKNQQYVKKICNEENTGVRHLEHDPENSKNQKAKYEKYESNVQIKLMNRISTLCKEIEWWKQRFERNQAALITMTREKQKAETELMEFVKKVTELQNMCDIFEREKLNLLLQIKNEIKKASEAESFNALSPQKSILYKENQISSETNSVASNIQNTLNNQVPEIIAKGSDKYYITLPSVIWRQIIMEEEDYNYITLPTIKIANTDKTVKSRKQVDTDSNKDSLKELLTELEDKLKEKLNQDSVKIAELLNDLKTNDKSTFVEEPVSASIRNFNKDCITSSSIMRQTEEENCDYIMPLISSLNIDKELNKAVESPKQVDKDSHEDSVTESLMNLEDYINKIQDKNFVKIMKLLEDLKTNNKSTNVEKQASILTKDFNQDCITSIMRQREKEDDYDISLSSNKDVLMEPLPDFQNKLNKKINKNFVKLMELLEDLETNVKSTVVKEQVPALNEDFDKDSITSIIEQMEEENYDYNYITPPSISSSNTVDEELEKIDKLPMIRSLSVMRQMEEENCDYDYALLPSISPSNIIDQKLDKPDKLSSTTSLSITRQMEEENYDYDHASLPSISPPNVIDQELDTADELPSITSLSIMRQMQEENNDCFYITPPISPRIIDNNELDKVESPKQIDKDSNKDAVTEPIEDDTEKLNKSAVKIMELLENLKINYKSTSIEEQVPTLTKDFNKDYITLSSIGQTEEENCNYDYIKPSSISSPNIADKELDKAVELSKQVNRNSIKDISTESLTEFEDTTNKILNKEITKVTDLLEDLKTNDKSIIVEQKEQIQKKDKVTDGEKKNKRDDMIFMKNLILSLPFYELPLSNITKDQSIVKTVDRVSQSQSTPNYQSFDNCSLCQKSFNHHTSEQREKNQLGSNEIDANINDNHTKCQYCNLATDILMIKYNDTIDHVNNKFQTTENNKNEEHGHVSSEAVEEDQIINVIEEIINVIEENEIEEIKNTDSNAVSNKKLPYAKDVIFENNIEALAEKEILNMENTSNVAPKIDYKLNKRIAQNNNWTLYMETVF